MFPDSYEILDNIRLNFSPEGLTIMNITIAFIMFGVALDMSFAGFKDLIKKPKSFIIGLISQIFLLPFITFLLIMLLKPSTGVALGMILVASCPGGNVSNFISSLAKGNVELSVSLTAFNTIAAILITPFNFAFWGSLYYTASPLLRPIVIDPLQMLQTVIILLGIPLVLGLLFSKKFPATTKKILNPVRIASIFLFGGFVIGALSANLTNFFKFIDVIFLIVFIHNSLAFLSAYYFGKVFRVSAKDRRTIAIETGIQNSGLGLALIFNPKIFPPDLELGGMAFIAAWWGIWHLIAGVSLALFWRRKNINN